MGSMSKVSLLGRFVDVFGEKLEQHFAYLVGTTIESLTNKTVDYHVKGDVQLSNGNTFEIHHRWATQEEDAEGKELTDYPIESYFEDYLKGKTIQQIYIGTSDRDDEAYLFLVADDESWVEVPIGFEAHRGDFSGFAEELLTEEEREAFLKR